MFTLFLTLTLLSGFALVIGLLAAFAPAVAQPVLVYHDETYWHVGYLDADKQITAQVYHRLMCEALVQASPG